MDSAISLFDKGPKGPVCVQAGAPLKTPLLRQALRSGSYGNGDSQDRRNRVSLPGSQNGAPILSNKVFTGGHNEEERPLHEDDIRITPNLPS